jgi:HPt (histidine-containing phosphotransfer) domain-containing protein
MGILDLGRYNSIVYTLGGFLLFVVGVLALNHQVADRFASGTVGAKYVAEQRVQPVAANMAANRLAERLNAGLDINSPLEELRTAAMAYDTAVVTLRGGKLPTGDGDNKMSVSQLFSSDARKHLDAIDKQWGGYKALLKPVLDFSGSPYAAAAAPGATIAFSPRGEKLKVALEKLNTYGEANYKGLAQSTNELATLLQTENVSRASTLKWIQRGGMLLSVGLFGGILFYFLTNLRKEERIALMARKETQDILKTVNEGLFLLDRELNIGTERSLALAGIFRRQDLNGMTFDRLLRNIVPEKTLKTAMDYVALLWGERVNEKLVKTINPLNEVEVHFDNPAGGFDTHFLEFDFNRVKADGNQLSHLLVTVNDVTKRVMLARELQESQEKAQAQLDLLLRILHVDPDNLTSFLNDADVSLKMVNSILKEPAREESAFRAKIDGIYRQIHSVKGESSALGLKTVEQRAHAFEESLNDLKGRPNLSGSDFLPLVVKLDDIFNHLAQVKEMLSRLVDLHKAIASRRVANPSNEAGKVDAWLSGKGDDATLQVEIGGEGGDGSTGLKLTLESLAARVAESQSKRVALKCAGLEQVPEAYKQAVKDITIQLVRNAVVHGIEAPEERVKAQKSETGHLGVAFAESADGFELIVQDDGRGLQLDRIKEVAIQRGMITAVQAEALDARQVMALIFRPGFSTVDSVTTDAGRGAGMDLVRALVAELGGRVGLASAGGRFAKFKIWLPATQRAVAA